MSVAPPIERWPEMPLTGATPSGAAVQSIIASGKPSWEWRRVSARHGRFPTYCHAAPPASAPRRLRLLAVRRPGVAVRDRQQTGPSGPRGGADPHGRPTPTTRRRRRRRRTLNRHIACRALPCGVRSAEISGIRPMNCGSPPSKRRTRPATARPSPPPASRSNSLRTFRRTCAQSSEADSAVSTARSRAAWAVAIPSASPSRNAAATASHAAEQCSSAARRSNSI